MVYGSARCWSDLTWLGLASRAREQCSRDRQIPITHTHTNTPNAKCKTQIIMQHISTLQYICRLALSSCRMFLHVCFMYLTGISWYSSAYLDMKSKIGWQNNGDATFNELRMRSGTEKDKNFVNYMTRKHGVEREREREIERRERTNKVKLHLGPHRTKPKMWIRMLSL